MYILYFTGFLLLWGIMFAFTTTMIGIFKKEKNAELEDADIKINICQTYKILWDITKIKHMKLLMVAVVTSLVNICLIITF